VCALEQEHVDFRALVNRVYHYYRRVLKQDRDDGVAANNIGVFMSNGGNPAGARPYFVRAVRLLPRDLNAHENLRVADILMRKPEARWHDYPEGLKPGKHTLAVYFDPHAM
jgi:Tfp pilus assembly protein PilF